MKIINLIAEYNPGFLVMQIGQHQDKFKDTVLVNAVQQLHHRRLAISLLTQEQMAILHQYVQQKACEDGFNSLATKISD